MASSDELDLSDRLAALGELTLDLRWTWSHEADALWRLLDGESWERTRNPWIMLKNTPQERLQAIAADPVFAAELQRVRNARNAYLGAPGWFASSYPANALKGIAYFSMEFGVGEALPLYAGGLGVLAGDYLKTASDLGVPIIGIGLLYGEGYFRQLIDAHGWQQETYPANDPGSLPIRPALGPDQRGRYIALDLPGRSLRLRVWQAQIGRTALYLLDANDPLNSPADRGITGRLYDPGRETRLLQELVLGVAGWRVVEAVAPDTEICHLNEGHTAFVVIERACALARRTGLPFWVAFCAARAGNVFTTHTPVEAAFDRFPPALVGTYLRQLDGFLDEAGVAMSEILALGRVNPNDADEPFNMAYLAMRGAAHSIGVSRQHEGVSRRIFQPLFAGWPEAEVPVGHVTNGIHVPTWDSVDADRLWTAACGKERWRCVPDSLPDQVAVLDDNQLWAMRTAGRRALVVATRNRLCRQLAARGDTPGAIAAAAEALDHTTLTLGFAHRFTGYKRPNLLLLDAERLCRLLTDTERPSQLIIAGKAHPADDEGKRMIAQWIALARTPELRGRIVFLEDYDLALAQELVQGVDVWINTPRRGWEACGTSGMKVLVNGGLNLSVRDGWWEEAFDPVLGWAVDGGPAADRTEGDRGDATTLYDRLEQEIVPEFYERDAAGLPRRWLARIRTSLSRLTPAYSSNRMLQEHLDRLYLPSAAEYRRRTIDGGAAAVAMREWECRLRRGWPELRIDKPVVTEAEGGLHFAAPVHLGDIAADHVAVQLYAEAKGDDRPTIIGMIRLAPNAGSANACIYTVEVTAGRPAADYTIRIIPAHRGVSIPAELPLIRWQK